MDWSQRTYADALHWGMREHGPAVAVIDGSRRLTYAELVARVDRFAAGLLDLGIRPGDKVGIWLPDCLEWMIARWAIPTIGAVLVPINTRFRDSDLRYVLQQSDCAALILQARYRTADFLGVLGRIVPDLATQKPAAWNASELPALKAVIGVGGDLPASVTEFAEVEDRGVRVRDDGAAVAAARKRIRPEDIAQLLYTSGTTSFPKGAMVRHGALLQNNYNTIARMNLTPSDRYLATSPLFSATGTSFTLSPFLAGAAVVLMDGFSAETFCRSVEEAGVTAAFFVEPMVHDLMTFSGRSRYRLSTLRTGTGAPLTAKSFRWIAEELGASQLTNVYGLSETSNAVCRSYWHEPLEDRIASSGLPMPGVELRIDDLETGRPLPPGGVGEIRVRGYTVCAGYYRMPDETAKAIDPEGWLHTGDLGELRADRRLVFRGRVKEMIKPGGFNVATLEVEDFLKTYPGVREAVLVGVPDARLGEVGYAFIERENGATLDPDAIIQFCKAHIAGYKVPRYVEFVSDWPRTSTGKLRKLELKSRAGQRVQS